MVGWTDSLDFPATTGAFDTTPGGMQDGFCARVDPSGATLLWATYLGGLEEDEMWSVVADSDGSAWITGRAYSHNFPVTPGVFDDTWNGSFDIVALKITSTGDDLVFSTFLGGVRRDEGKSIAVYPNGVMALTGIARSPNFPVTHGAYDETPNGHYDAFVATFSPDATELLAATYVGGETIDDPQAIAIDENGDILIAGLTWSEEFPATPANFDDSFNGLIDGFLSRLDPTLERLLYSTYIGGPLDDRLFDIAARGTQAIAVGSARDGYPVSPDAWDPTYNGALDATLAIVDPVSSAPASWQNYGNGWPGTIGIPSLEATWPPVLCTSTSLLLTSSMPTPTQGVFFIGLSSDNTPTPWGGTLLVVPTWTFTLTLSAGTTTLPFPIKCDDSLLGMAIYTQMLLIDPGASHGVSFTPGIEFILGG